MKKLFLLSTVVMLALVIAKAENPEFKFETTTYDFGSIEENNGNVVANFVFTNVGDAPLTINGVSASCGCTVADWTREPVAVNGTGSIKVSYNPKGRPGRFAKSVRVNSNSTEQPLVLQIKGEVIRAEQ